MFESRSGIVLVAGLVFFGFAFLSNAVVPVLMYQNLPEKTVAELINGNLRYQFEDLQRRFPASFEKAYGTPPTDPSAAEKWYNEKCADALRLGRKLYVGEGCWHCHSQFVRPVSNEEERFGPVSRTWEYQNELQRPVMFGTRRVGPDLSREGGRRSNDWHAVHFFRPRDLAHNSVMPEYPWFFDGSADKPTVRGLALITYVQWLGSWLESYPEYEQYEVSPVFKIDLSTADADEAEPEMEAEPAPDAAPPPESDIPQPETPQKETE